MLAIVLGSQYNVVERANLPRLPIGDETLTTGGAIATVVLLLGTLLFAALGGSPARATTARSTAPVSSTEADQVGEVACNATSWVVKGR